jgi:hypothetical protein
MILQEKTRRAFLVRDHGIEAVPTVSRVPGVPHVIDVPIVQPLRSSPDRAVPIVPVVPSLRSVQIVGIRAVQPDFKSFNSSIQSFNEKEELHVSRMSETWKG